MVKTGVLCERAGSGVLVPVSFCSHRLYVVREEKKKKTTSSLLPGVAPTYSYLTISYNTEIGSALVLFLVEDITGEVLIELMGAGPVANPFSFIVSTISLANAVARQPSPTHYVRYA